MFSKKTVLGILLVALFALSFTGSWLYLHGSNTAFAQTEKKMGWGKRGFHPGKMEVSPEVQKLMDELRGAQEAGDTAKVADLRAQIKKERDVERTAREAEMDKALQGGYDAWKAYATSQGLPADMIAKITPENFPTLVELHDTQKKEQELRAKLGLDDLGFHRLKM